MRRGPTGKARASRRTLLKYAGLLGGAMIGVLSASWLKRQFTSITEPRTPYDQDYPIQGETPLRGQRTLVGVARDEEVSTMVRDAIELVGGFDFSPGDAVLVKPNVNSDDPYPATTNPKVVGEVVRAVKEMGPGEVIVADHSNPAYDTMEAMRKTGIYRAASEAGAVFADLEEYGWVRVKPKQALNWENGFEFSRLVLDADYLISLPVVHTHFIAGYSMALKNMVGALHPRSRSVLHSRGEPNFGRMIAELCLPRLPDFVVLDATKVFISGGPFSGDVRKPGLVAATKDVVAADVVGLAVLRYYGAGGEIKNRSPWSQVQVARAVELGFGAKSPGEIELLDRGVEELEDLKKLLI